MKLFNKFIQEYATLLVHRIVFFQQMEQMNVKNALKVVFNAINREYAANVK